MTIKQALCLSTKKLSKYSTSSALDTEVLLSFVLKKEKSYAYSYPEKSLTKKQATRFNALIKQRTKGAPVAYLTGYKEFYGSDFLINKNVLIPRPETETLVELVLEKIKRENGLKILDLGTGSGCIITSLAKNLKNKNFYFASDISKKALVVAKKNAEQHAVKILFKSGDLLKPWKKEKFDVIVANLPYGWKQWKNNSSAETLGLKFEPQNALFTKEQGLHLIKTFFKQLSQVKHKPALVFFEFDPRQVKQIKKLAEKFLPEFTTAIFKDLRKQNRFVLLAQKSF